MGGFASIVDGLRQRAESLPSQVAVVQQDVSVCYRDLQARIDAITAGLQAQGIRPGQRAALLLESSIDYIVAYYGAMAAGAVAVPLNTAARPRDLAECVRHSEAGWLLTRSGNAHLADLHADLAGVQTVLVDAVACTAVARQPDRVRLDADAPACILYTSGTTGAPKGVLLSHGNLAANAAAIMEYLGLTERDSIVCVLPFHYSYGSSVLHTHLLAGATLIIEQNLVYPHRVVELLSRLRATGFAGVPSTYSLLLARVALEKYDLSGLRYLTQAGGAMPAVVLERLRKALPDVPLFIMYGQTEATARVTWLPPRDLETKPGSVGRPVRGMQIQIRSPEGDVCAPGETGDVWVSGTSVMQGYWRDVEATDAVLQSGWLNTRDMGWLDHDGYLFLHGRRSDIIKVGAHRVNPLEIEGVVAQLGEVEEAAASGVDDDLLGQVIRVSVVPAAGCTIDPLKIRAHCLAQLASYKVPKYVTIVESLPKTTSGKIRRHEL